MPIIAHMQSCVLCRIEYVKIIHYMSTTAHTIVEVLSNRKSQVLIFCVDFRELSNLARDLFQAEKKINVATS